MPPIETSRTHATPLQKAPRPYSERTGFVRSQAELVSTCEVQPRWGEPATAVMSEPVSALIMNFCPSIEIETE